MVLKKWVAAATAAAVALTSGYFSVIPGANAAAAEEETESVKVVEIGTLEELEKFRDDVNSGNDYAGVTVKLTDDIDLQNKEWTPIGDGSEYFVVFSGVFDGGEHEIKGLYINRENDGGCYGLFGTVSYGTIINLKVSGEIHSAESDSTISVGGIAGNISNSTIDNCYSNCTISGSGNAYAGGIAGSAEETRITRCSNAGNINITVVDAYWDNAAGGIAGEVNGGEIENCCNTGSISITVNNDEYSMPICAGGIAGRCELYDTYIINSYNIGTVNCTSAQPDDFVYAGGIVGYNNFGEDLLKGCFYLDGTAEHALGNYDELVPSDQITSEDTCLISDEQLADENTFKAEGWDFVNIWKMSAERPVLTDSSVHVHDDIKFAPWTRTDCLPEDTGVSWYLTEDVTLDRNNYNYNDHEVFGYGYQKKTNLCLNGHTVTFEDGSIVLHEGDDIGFYDCDSEKKGTVRLAEIYTDSFYLFDEPSRLTIYGGNFYFDGGVGGGMFEISEITIHDGNFHFGNSMCGGLSEISEITIHAGNFYFDGPGISGGDILTINGGYFTGKDTVISCADITEINGGTFIKETDEDTTEYIDTTGIVRSGCGTLTVNGGTFGDGRSDICIYNEYEGNDSGTINFLKGTVNARHYGIYNEYGVINLSGGTVIGGDYGVYNNVYSGSTESIINLSGSPEISGGTADIYLLNYYGSDTYVNITGELTNEKPYSIEMAVPDVFTDSEDTELNDPARFVSAVPGYTVSKNDEGQLELVPADLTVTLDYNDGTEKTETITVKYLEEYPELPEPTREGYVFDGWWYTDVEDEELPVLIYHGLQVDVPNDHTLHAMWIDESELDDYITVTLHFQYTDDEDETEEIMVTPGGIYGSKLPGNPVRDGYTFDGWYTEAEGGERVFSNTIVDYCYDLYAHWTENTETEPDPDDPDTPQPEGYVTVTFDYQGADGGDTTPSKTVKVGGTYGELPVPTRTGYTFDGWYTEETDGTLVESGTDVIGNTNHTLYAHWTKNAETEPDPDVPLPEGYITVTFDYQDADGDNTVASKNVKADGTYGELPAPSKTGYIFEGWYTEADGGTLVTADTDVAADTDHTLYAHWKECKDHDIVYGKAVNPTCTEDGREISEYCSKCGKLLVEGQIIPALGHDWDESWELVTAPTLTDEGAAERVCLRDDSHVEQTDVPALSDETVWTLLEDYAPTCRIDGGQRYFSHEYGTVDIILPKLGHQWDEGTITVAPTATTNGRIVYTCKVCGDTTSESIPALGGGSSGGGTTSRPSTTTTTTAPEPSATTAPEPEASETTTPEPESTVTTAPAPEPTATTTPAPEPSSTTTTAPAAGNSTVSADSGANAPDVSIDRASSDRLENEVLARHLTAAEKAAIESGARLEIVIAVEDASAAVSAAEKSSAEKIAAASNYTVGQYLNIDILKLIDGEETGKITELDAPVSITVDVPKALRNNGRKFAIVRIHDGETKLLTDTDSNPDTITISTDRFSVYAIVYQDKTDAETSSGSGNSQATGSASGNPHTGVHPATELAVLAIAFGGTAVLFAVTKLTIKKK